MSDFTYTNTDRMRDAIANSDWMDVGRVDPETIAAGYAYFDHWLNEERAKAWDEGQLNGEFYLNPYRKADQ